MILKSCILFFLTFLTDINAFNEYKYNSLAGGWLKWHQSANFEDAATLCDSEGAILVSPLTSQIRDAVRSYLKRSNQSPTVISGVRATYSGGDYFSRENVNLQKMPVVIDSEISEDPDSPEGCVKWVTNQDIVQYERCDTKLPFVCFRKRLTSTVAGCKTTDPEYIYNERSGSCYKFHSNGMPWIKAYNKCKSEGAYLAVSNSKLETVVMKEFFNKYPSSVTSSTEFDRVFVGIRDWLDGESWKTVTGQTLEDAGFTGWARSEPNNLGGKEHCVSMYRDGTYNDDNCDMSLIFLCEKKPEILYTNVAEY